MKCRSEFVSNFRGIPQYSADIFKKKSHDFALVIPVINEGERIIRQLEKIYEFQPKVDIIIADGGSTDTSATYFQSENHRITAVLTKLGSGKLSAQLRMAFHFCIKNNYKAIILMDGNDKDAVSGIHHISTALLQGYDFVQGSRFISGGIAENTPISRYLAIRLLHAPITSIAAGKYFTDTTNGFRGIRTSALMDDRISYNREIFLTYELIAYLPIRFSKLGFKCIEVPVSRIYPKNQKIPTKILGFRGPISLLGILLKAAWGKYDPITKANHRQKI